MKLKLKKTTTSIVEVDVQFPVYKSFLGAAFVKVISEDLSIRVGDDSAYSTSVSESFLTDSDYKDSNEKEFTDAFNKTILKLKKLAL